MERILVIQLVKLHRKKPFYSFNQHEHLRVCAREAGLARGFEVDDQPFRLGDRGRYRA